MPSELVTALWAVPVSTAVMPIWAPVTTAPDWSVTRPVMVAMETACACSAGAFPSAMKVSSRVLTAVSFLGLYMTEHNLQEHMGPDFHPNGQSVYNGL